VGVDYTATDRWKVKARYEKYDDDDSATDTIEGAYVVGADYKLGENTALMIEYRNVMGEGTEKDKTDIGIGIKTKL